MRYVYLTCTYTRVAMVMSPQCPQYIREGLLGYWNCVSWIWSLGSPCMWWSATKCKITWSAAVTSCRGSIAPLLECTLSYKSISIIVCKYHTDNVGRFCDRQQNTYFNLSSIGVCYLQEHLIVCVSVFVLHMMQRSTCMLQYLYCATLHGHQSGCGDQEWNLSFFAHHHEACSTHRRMSMHLSLYWLVGHCYSPWWWPETKCEIPWPVTMQEVYTSIWMYIL